MGQRGELLTSVKTATSSHFRTFALVAFSMSGVIDLTAVMKSRKYSITYSTYVAELMCTPYCCKTFIFFFSRSVNICLFFVILSSFSTAQYAAHAAKRAIQSWWPKQRQRINFSSLWPLTYHHTPYSIWFLTSAHVEVSLSLQNQTTSIIYRT